jgi:hypothetical protein
MTTSKPSSTAAGFNPRAVAGLFKLEVYDAFNAWSDSRPMRTGFPHASNILAPDSEYCLRKLVLMAAYPEHAQRPERKPWDTTKNMIFKSGWSLHEKYQSLLHRYSTVAYHEGQPELDLTHFDETRLIYFSPDVVQNHLGEHMPLEIKGYNNEHFEKLDELGEPPKDAYKQVNFYMHLMELQHGLILVENKNNQQIKTWCVEYDRELVQPYIDRMHKFKLAYVQVAKMGKEPPARVCESSKSRMAEKCEMCSFCFQLEQ